MCKKSKMKIKNRKTKKIIIKNSVIKKILIHIYILRITQMFECWISGIIHKIVQSFPHSFILLFHLLLFNYLFSSPITSDPHFKLHSKLLVIYYYPTFLVTK